MKQFQIGNFVRPEQKAIEIGTISVSELMKLAGADGLRPQPTQYGTKLFLCKGDTTLSVKAIRIGDKANLSSEPITTPAGLKHLVNNNELYYGESDNGTWLCFSRKGTLVPGKVISFAEIMAATGTTAAELNKTM